MKSLNTIFKVLLRLAMVTLFIYNAYTALTRFMEKEKSVHVTFNEVQKVQYPSLTICKRKAFNESIDSLLHGNHSRVDEYVKAIKTDVVKKEDIFYFVSHPNMTESEHPCLTTSNSLDPGKPCVFPFTYKGKVYDSCDSLYFTLGWCGTKDVVLTQDWGYCSGDCENQNLISNGKGDLTKNERFWESRFFDLRSWEEGNCYTYNPPQKSFPGTSGGLGIFFKKTDLEYFQSYNIYLHEKGQFWPGNELQHLGQSEKIILKEKMEISGKFKIELKIKQEGTMCKTLVKYSLTDCISNYIIKKVGCKASWISQSADQKVKECTKATEIQGYKEIMINLKEKALTELSTTTRCYPKCEITSYSFFESEKKEVKFPQQWASSFFLHSSNSPQMKSSEQYIYTFPRLTSDIGGYLGLFLGWSILFIALEAPTLILDFTRKLYGMASQTPLFFFDFRNDINDSGLN